MHPDLFARRILIIRTCSGTVLMRGMYLAHRSQDPAKPVPAIGIGSPLRACSFG